MIFDQLNIFGVDPADEMTMFAGMLLGDPILLIGPHGSAKTELGKSVAIALQENSKRDNPINEVGHAEIQRTGLLPEDWFKFATYDCSKMQFEEIIGFPNPSTFQEGHVSYVESPVTIWGKQMVILDEFNRQNSRQQNSLFELIRSRTIYGQETGTKMIVACMNPFGMEGTEILDEALVDRMAMFIYTKSFDKLDDEVREDIIQKIGANDSPGIGLWSDYVCDHGTSNTEINETLADVGKQIETLLTRGAEIFFELKKEAGPAYSLFIDRFVTLLKKEGKEKDLVIDISSRRAAMMFRSLLAYRAVEMAFSELHGTDIESLEESFSDILIRTLPVGISESAGAVNADLEYVITTTLGTMASFFTHSDYSQLRTSMDVLGELLTSDNITRKTRLIIEYGQVGSALSFSMWNEISSYEAINIKANLNEKNIQKLMICFIVGNLYHYSSEFIPENVAEKILEYLPSHKSIIKEASAFIDFTYSQIEVTNQIKTDIEGYKVPLQKVFASLLWKEVALTDGEINFKKNAGEIFDKTEELAQLIEEFKKLSKSKPILPGLENVVTAEEILEPNEV
jgi:hypothetical protein